MFVAMVVVPTPPFGLKTATVRFALVIVTPSEEMTGARSRDRWKRRSRASTLRLELACVEGPGHDVVGTGFEIGDPLLDLVGGASPPSPARRPRPATPGTRWQMSTPERARRDIEHDQLMAGALVESDLGVRRSS